MVKDDVEVGPCVLFLVKLEAIVDGVRGGMFLKIFQEMLGVELCPS